MKFICCTHNKNEKWPFDIYVMPDTALHINKRPFFIPDYAEPCMMHVHQAIHIHRLGRSISERFASRYYDAATLCTRMEAPNLPHEVGRTFDECISVGEWIPIEQIPNSEYKTDFLAEANKAVNIISQYFTLRQGDIVLLSTVREPKEVAIDQHIEETYCGKTVLQFNIK